MGENSYKIELGIKLKDNAIQNEINEAQRTLKPIEIKVDAETKELTNTIKEALNSLSKGTKNALTLDTSKIESSLKDVADEIRIIKSSIGTLDGGDMKSLLTTINQMNVSLDKASNQFVELNRSLDALSKKDFSLDIGIKLGGSNSVTNNSLYGDFVKDDVLPTLKKQEQALTKYLAKYFNTNEFSAVDKLLSKSGNGLGGVGGVIEIMDRLESPLKKGESLKDRMREYKNFINSIMSSANMQGIDLSPVLSQFEKLPNELIETADNIRNGTKQVDDSIDKLKQAFGGGVGTEGLSASLEPIINNLTEIKITLQDLSKGFSLDGLTTSFDRLSDSIENLLANAERVKGVLNSNLGNSPISKISTADTTPIKSAQQTGQKIGETVTKVAQHSINLDDVIDKQVTDLMEKYAIAGEKGSDAFNKIKQALLECRTELEIIKNGNFDIDEQAFGNSAAIDKVTNALSEQMRVANETAEVHGRLADYIKKYNTGGYKVHLPDSIKQEYGDDYVRMARTLGSAFTTGKGQDFESFIEDLNNELGETISLSSGAEAAFKQLHDEVVYDRAQTKSHGKKQSALLSEDELFDRNYLSREEVYDDTISAINAISAAEQQIAQSSTQATNTVVQSEERKQQAYKETANQYDKIAQGTSLVRDDADFKKTFNATNQAAQEAQRHFQELLADERAVVSVTEQFDNVNALQSFVVNVKRASGEVETLRYVMDKLDDEENGRFRYQSGSATDRNVEKQLEARIKKANDLQIRLDKIKSGYGDMGAAKPIRDSGHIEALDEQYTKVKNAIIDVRNADDSTFLSMVSNAEKERAVLESMVREFRNAETVATSLRSKDISTTKEVYASKLDVLISKMKDTGVYTSGFEKGAENLRSALSNATDKNGLISFLNGLDKLEAGYKRATQSAKSFKESQIYGQKASGLESEIKNLQRIDSEINQFEAEINGAKVSVQSLLKDLSQVKTKSDFQIAEGNFKAFKKAAEAAGIAIKETATKLKSVKDIKIKLDDTGFNGFEQEVKRAHNAAEELEGVYPELEAALQRLDIAMGDVYSADQANDARRLVAANEEYEASLKQVYSQLKLNQQAEENVYKAEMLQQKKASLNSKMEVWLKENSRAAKDFGEEIRRLQASLNGLDDRGVKLVGQQFKNLKKQAQVMGKTGLTVFDKLKSKAKEYMAYFSVAEIFMYVEQGLREMFNTVKEIDTAMTGLYRVTDLTAAEYDTLFNDMISSAKEYGATLNDIINATTDWVRAGFDANTSLGLAEVTTMYQHISDLDYDTAAENLITAYNGFKDELNGAFSGDQVAAVNYIADVFNELDNNFAVTSAGLGEALTRSASALDLAGNSIQETAGMITGIVEVTQDPEQAGSTLKILSLRLRGMKGALEELGEETDENVENLSKMQGQVLNLTKGKVNIFDGAGEFRSTYEIMKDISEVWDDLNSTAQADLLETIAGKHRANSVAALLSNWKNVEAAVKSASEAEGSAARENAKYVDSIQGRLDKLTTSWQSFANSFMSSDFLKGAVSGLTGFVELIEGLVKNIGTLGTIGLGAGIFAMFKNKGLFTGILGTFSTLGSVILDVWKSGGKLTTRLADIGRAAWAAGGDIKRGFGQSLSGIVGGIGLLVAGIGLAINAYKNYREEISKARQETIQSSDEFLDSASSFEQAYIKYSGRTNLTAEEEAELESAIKGTVDALGDKSSALQNVVNSSNDYVSSLEAITNAELKAADASAKKKLEAAKAELEWATIGETIDGSEVDVSLRSVDSTLLAQEIMGDYVKITPRGKDNYRSTHTITLDADASANDILDYYYKLLALQEKMLDPDVNMGDTIEYERVTEAIDKMKDAVAAYENGVYDAAKAQYQLSNGIPKTTEEYLKMRETLLRDEKGEYGIQGLSLDAKKVIAGSLDSEYGQAFDLTTAEVQAKKLIGVLDEYGENEAGQMETFLNMRTAVNNNECTVGEYMSQFDDINKMTEEWSDAAKEELNTSFGLDTDTIKHQYKDMSDYLLRLFKPQENDGESLYRYAQKVKSEKEKAKLNIDYFLDSLTADELAAVIDIKAEIDWQNTSAEDIRKQIEDQAKLNEALSFEANVEADTTALETLNDILTESASAMGLSSEAIDSLKAKYADLDSFDSSTLFEATGNGVKVNREELEKLEKEYNDLTKNKVKEHLDTLADKYNDVTAEIDKCTNAGERAELLAERETYADKIEELATYQAQLEGVTGAYQDWINAQNTPEDYEGYEAVATSREDIESEIDRGFIGNSTKKYIDLLSGEDLDGKSVDDYAEAWEKLDEKVTGAGYSVNDFFTVNDDGDITSTGIDRFFKSLQTDFEGSVAKFDDKTKKWSYDFGSENLEKIKEKWGIGIEAIELLLEAAASAGYDIDWDGILDGIDLDTSNFETLVSTAEAAQVAFNKLDGVEDVDFNFTATGVEEATSELEKARSTYIDLITNKDGTINLNAKGAEEMRVILATLLIQKQQLEDSNIAINIDTSGLDESQQDIANAINAVKNFREKYKNLEIAVTTGQGIEEAKTELNTAMAELQGLGDAGVDIAAELILGEGATAESLNSKVDAAISAVGSKDIKVGCKLDETALGTLNSQVLANFTPEATVKITGIDDSLVGEYTATEKTANGKVKWSNDTSLVIEFQNKTQKAKGIVDWANNVEKVKTQFSAAGTIKWTSGNKVKVNVVSEAKGTANADGTTSGRAFARGNWGIKGFGTALGGELGRELVVRDGKFFTIGDTGAEFFRYKPNDIIFNAAQTESLFKYGGIKGAKPRGTMFASGSAFTEGSAFAWGATGVSSKFALSRFDGGGSSSSKKKTTKSTKKDDSSAKTKTETTTKDNSVTTTTTTTWGAKASESNFSNKRSDDSNVNKENDTKEFEEVFDWVETAIERIEREIDNLDRTANSVYKSWSERNKALASEISKVSEEINLQNDAAQEYLKKANSVGLSESWAKRVREGALDIDTLNEKNSSEETVEKIKDYQKWYELYLDCIDAVKELREEESSLYAQRFEHIQSEYDNLLQGFDHTEAMLNEYINQAEEQGYIVSRKYYEALTDNEKNRITKLKQEQAALIAERDKAVADGKIDKFSEEWYNMCQEVDDVTQAIEEGETAILSYANAIRDIEWEVFDLMQERISDITAEADFLIELMSNEKLFDDNNKFTGQGLATAGLHAQNYNTYMYQADLAGEEAEKLKKQLAENPYDRNLESRYREMIELQREYILAAEDSKNAIVDLVREGIELEIDALDEKIQKYEDALDAQKDLYDYQKRISEQTKNIASLQKQLSSLQGDDSEETRAKIQELRVSLEEAKADLEETQYEKFISDQSALLDNLFLEYETLLNERLDNTDDIVRQVVDAINGSTESATVGSNNIISQLIGTEGNMTNVLGGHAEAIKDALNKEVTSVGVKLSDAMNNIWNAGERPVLTMYGDSFQNKQTTTNSVLNSIKSSVDSMVSSLNKQAAAKATANKTSSSSVKNSTTTTTTNNKTNTNNQTSSNAQALTDDKLMGIAASIWIYGHDSGWGNDPVRSGKLTQKFGLATAKKVQGLIDAHSANGDLYRFWVKHNYNLDKYYYNAFKFGAKKIDESQLAWTQENGQEYIVRPSDGAILTPVAKGDSVLTSSASNNIWKMANSPAEFIKDNLNFGTTNVPNNSNVQNSCVQNFDKVVFSMPNVHNYQEFLSEMQKDKNFERLVESMTIGKLAGKSSLAKGKAIR